jgi:hypothetical protein
MRTSSRRSDLDRMWFRPPASRRDTEAAVTTEASRHAQHYRGLFCALILRIASLAAVRGISRACRPHRTAVPAPCSSRTPPARLPRPPMRQSAGGVWTPLSLASSCSQEGRARAGTSSSTPDSRARSAALPHSAVRRRRPACLRPRAGAGRRATACRIAAPVPAGRSVR